LTNSKSPSKNAATKTAPKFVGDMVRDLLVKGEWDKHEEVLGTITLIYDHHQNQLSEKLTNLQHEHHDAVLVTRHVHLSHDLCAEVIFVRGRANLVRQLADAIQQQKAYCTRSCR
jgi:CopG family transcriptional regulator, nickel-responsive regulator